MPPSFQRPLANTQPISATSALFVASGTQRIRYRLDKWLGGSLKLVFQETLADAIRSAAEYKGSIVVATKEDLDSGQVAKIPAGTTILCVIDDVDSDGLEATALRGATDFIRFDAEPAEARARIASLLKISIGAGEGELLDPKWSFLFGGPEFGAWDWDTETDCVLCSASVIRIAHRGSEETTITRDAWMEWVHPADRERVKVEVARLSDGSGDSELEHQYRLISADGTNIWISERLRVLEWNGTAPRRVFGVITDFSERRASERRLVQLANYDGLTGLANKKRCENDLVEQISRSEVLGTLSCLFRVDVVGLAKTNQSYGRSAGDQLLVQVADRLKRLADDESRVYRLGGKEFALMAPLVSGGAKAEIIESTTRELLEALTEPYTIGRQVIPGRALIGVAEVDEGCSSGDEVIRRAEIALDHAEHSANAYAIFRPDMMADVESRARLVEDLERAVFSEQIYLAYQPIVDASGRAVGAEALARWDHPRRGLMKPSEFIPLAEDTGLIVPMGSRLRRVACELLGKWSRTAETAHLTLSINVSPAEFRAEGFLGELLALVRANRIPPQRLFLEVTESLLLGNFPRISDTMTQLRKAGVGLILDDFGTGYSSFSYLKRLPFERLKLDRSFVRDLLVNPIDASLSRTILSMAVNLGLEPVAEGIEQDGQAALLYEMGCRRFQGFLFGKPSVPERVVALCASGGRAAKPEETGTTDSAPESTGIDEEARILIVDDDPITVRVLHQVLSGYRQIEVTTDPHAARGLADEFRPDVILLDAQMPDLDGFEVMTQIRTNPELRDVPVIFVTGIMDQETELQAMTLGASDFVSKPISAPRIRVAVRNQLRMKRTQDFLRKQAHLDPLTSLPNKRAFDAALERELSEMANSGGELSVMMFEVDSVRAIAERGGYAAGEAYFRRVGGLLAESASSPEQVVARIGTDRYAMLLPKRSEDSVRDLAERLLADVARAEYSELLPPGQSASVSIGCATCAEGKLPEAAGGALLDSVEDALATAVEAGRGRAVFVTVSAGQPEDDPDA